MGQYGRYITRGGKNSEFPREIFFRGAPLDLGPQGIPEALRAAFGDLEWTFGPSKTMPGREKVENLENRILEISKILNVRQFLFFFSFFPQTAGPQNALLGFFFSSGPQNI